MAPSVRGNSRKLQRPTADSPNRASLHSSGLFQFCSSVSRHVLRAPGRVIAHVSAVQGDKCQQNPSASKGQERARDESALIERWWRESKEKKKKTHREPREGELCKGGRRRPEGAGMQGTHAWLASRGGNEREPLTQSASGRTRQSSISL